MDEELVKKIHTYETSDLPEHIKLALEFTEGWVLHNAQTIDEDLIRRMKEHFTEAQIVELAYLLIWANGMHRLYAAFDVEGPDGLYKINSGKVPEATKAKMKDLGFAVVAKAFSINDAAPPSPQALFIAQGEDVESELISHVRENAQVGAGGGAG